MKYKSTKKFVNDLKPFLEEDDFSVIIEMVLIEMGFCIFQLNLRLDVEQS